MKKRAAILLLILSIVTFITHLCLLSQMPDTVPIHWNAAGEVDGYSGKETTLLLAALPFLMMLLFHYIPKMDPRGDNYKKHEKAYTIFRILTILFMNGMVWITDAYILGFPVKINQFIPIGVGILLIVIGNYMPQIRPNYTLGIKTPWALNNEWVWKKTHNMGGITFIVMGLLMLLSGIFPYEWLAMVAAAVLIIGIIWMYIYSYLMYRKWLRNGTLE